MWSTRLQQEVWGSPEAEGDRRSQTQRPFMSTGLEEQWCSEAKSASLELHLHLETESRSGHRGKEKWE